MRAAASSLILLAGLAGLAGCNDAPQQAEPDNAAVTEIEALPPDESVDMPPDDLENGAAEPTNTGAPQE